MNIPSFINTKGLFIFFVNMGIIILINIIQFGVIIFLGWLTLYFESTDKLGDIDPIGGALLIPTLILVAINIILELVVKPFLYKMTEWENIRRVSNFETSYAIKLAVFNFVNILGPCIMQGFIIESLIGCAEGDCYAALGIFLRILFVVNFLKNFILTLIPCLKYIIKRT